jgi:hypothetical protein
MKRSKRDNPDCANQGLPPWISRCGNHDHRAGTAVPFAVVVGSSRRKAHGQQKALTVATDAKREQNACCGTDKRLGVFGDCTPKTWPFGQLKTNSLG